MGGHAKLAPSSAAIWSKCEGQPVMAAGCPDEPSEYALRGTAAHKVLDDSIRIPEYEPQSYVDHLIADTSVTFDQEDCDAVNVALDWIRSQIEDGDEWGSETKLHYSDDHHGTCDFWRYRPSTAELLIVDYKHGSGVSVEAFENLQGLSYGKMKAKALGNRGISSLRFVIIQPRCYHHDGPIREWTLDAMDILDWSGELDKAIERCRQAQKEWDEMAPTGVAASVVLWQMEHLTAGDHCRWCPAAGAVGPEGIIGCPTLRNKTQATAQKDFGPTYDVNELAAALNEVPLLLARAKALHEFGYAEAEKGVKIPGWILSPKRPTRRFKDAKQVEDAVDMLGFAPADIYEPPVLKSPAQLEIAIAPTMSAKTKKAKTAAAKAMLAPFIEAVSSGHALVKDDGSRKPVREDATEDFAAAE